MNKLRFAILALLIAFAGATVEAVDTEVSSHGPHVEAVAKPVVKVVNGHVEITVPGDDNVQVIIYALTGQVVKNVTVPSGTSIIDLPAGYYIVKCDGLSQRVIVR